MKKDNLSPKQVEAIIRKQIYAAIDHAELSVGNGILLPKALKTLKKDVSLILRGGILYPDKI